ncbi:FtsX-like permease family protein [Candidatus Microgenomates bacterium]|nr:MAG: FtsX-like permease family protein [Candidatus Microgenomates bacterium]
MSIHLKTSLGNIRRAPFQAMAAVSVLAVTFFVTTLVSVVVFSSEQVLRYFETRPQVIAFLTDEAQQEDINVLVNKLSSDARVNSLRLVTREEALNIYKEATRENPLLGELVSPSIFPASIEFSARELNVAQSLIDEVKAESIVESVGFTATLGGESAVSDVIDKLNTVALYIRSAGAIAITVLAGTSFLVLMVVIGMRIITKKNEIDSLSLIGASPWFIKSPIVLEAIHYSVMGVTIGWLVASVLVMYATPAILKYFGDIPVLPKESSHFFLLLGAILVGELLIGFMIALLGSLFAVSRTLKFTK